MLSSRLTRSLLLASVLLPGCVTAHAKEPFPEWVRAAAAQPATGLARDADAVFLLEETTYSIAPDGTRTVHVRKVVRVLRPQGRKYGELYASFGIGSKLRYLHIWSIGPDGKEYTVKDNEQTEVGTGEGFELYSDGRARGARAPAMDVGAVAAIEYERLDHPYDNDILWVPGEEVPVLRERMTLNLPDGFTFKSAWKGKPKTDAVDAEHGQTLWEVKDQAGMHRPEHIPFAPSEISLAPRMDIFYQGPNVAGAYGAMKGDWQDIGEWYERLAKDRNKPDAAITAKAQELVAGKTDFRDRVDAIASFVQKDIRYVAIEIGVGGYQPHPAPDVFRARYGDCKDKATLLSAMLDAVGVRSTWVMVDTRRGVMANEAPSLMGNHMIAAIELPNGYKPEAMSSIVTPKSGKRFLIFDPTWEKTPFGQLEHELQGSDALLIDGKDSQAIRLPVLSPEQNTVERSASFQLAADGTLSGTVLDQENGDIARSLRSVFTAKTLKEQEETVDHHLSTDMINFSVTGIKAEHAADLERAMTLSYSVKAEGFARSMGPLLAVRPRVLGEESPYVDAKKRVLPIDLVRTKKVHDDFTIALPAGFDVDELPPSVDIDLGFAAYKSESKVENHAIHYSRTYTVREIALPADRYADLQKLARTIAGDEQSSAVLKRSN